jgi:BirA family biotin operon repressor/biotin-[acetyl-CoA-carboxylase] ligase
VVVAECQSAGRGRLGRNWDSPAGSNVYMTLLLRPELKPDQAPMLTLVMALSVAEALREMTGLDAQIKWPNDIVVNGKKVCGILTEMRAEVGYIDHVAIGAGINVNREEFPEELKEMATSLVLECGKAFSREEILAGILEHFQKDYDRFMKTGSFRDLKADYETLLVNRGKKVRVLGETEPYHAVALGINEKGELLVRREDGTETAVYAGEVSVRGIYGYV